MSGFRGRGRFGSHGSRGTMPFGPRHSSPHILEDSPGSPNVAPIPSHNPAGPAPNVRLFGPAASTGMAIPWGSGAWTANVPPVAIPTIQNSLQSQHEINTSRPNEKGDGRRITSQNESSNADRKSSDFCPDHHKKQSETMENLDNRSSAKFNEYYRNNKNDRADGDRRKHDRADGDRHSDNGPVLYDNRNEANPVYSGQEECNSGSYRRNHEKFQNSRGRKDYSHGYSAREESSRYSEKDRSGRRTEDGGSCHRGAVLRDDRDCIPDDRGSVSSGHHSAKLIEDFDDRSSSRRYGGDRNWDGRRENKDMERYNDRGRDDNKRAYGNRGRFNRGNFTHNRGRGRDDLGGNRDLREDDRDYRNRKRDDNEIDREYHDRRRDKRESDRDFWDTERDGRSDCNNYSKDERQYNYQETARDERISNRNERGSFGIAENGGRDTRYIDRGRNDRGDYGNNRNSHRGKQDMDRNNRQRESRESGSGARDSDSVDARKNDRHNYRNKEFKDRGSHDRSTEHGNGDFQRRKGDEWRGSDIARERRGDNVERGRSGALLIEQGRAYDEQNKTTDKGRNSSHSHNVEKERGRLGELEKYINDKRGKVIEKGRTGAVLIEQKKDNFTNDRGNEGLQRGRSGALLLEDREEKRPVLRDNRDRSTDIGRTGALLIDDRGSTSASTKPDQPRGRYQAHRHNDQDRRFRSQERSSSSQRPFGRSTRSHERSHGQKRPWCSDESKWRDDKTLSDRDSLCDEVYSDLDAWPDETSSDIDRLSDMGSVEGEPHYKRRRVREPSQEAQPQCIRSGTPTAKAEMDEEPLPAWVRSSAADLYFVKDSKTGNMVTTKRMQDLEKKFDHELVQRNTRAKAAQEPYNPLKRPEPKWQHHHKCQGSKHDHHEDDSSSSSSSSSDSDSDSDQEEWWMEELRRKEQHPQRLHKELWHNDKGELNYGPLCRCSLKAQKTGIRHDKYPGEQPAPKCDLNSNNLDKLYHYKITVSPVTNFLTKHPTLIMFDGHEYMFEGFSIFTHEKLPEMPECQVIRFYIVYTVHVIEEPAPENFSIHSLDLFTQFLFDEILELFDIDWMGPGGDDNCRLFHVLPRFARPFPENGKEIMSINDVLLYLMKSSKSLMSPRELPDLLKLDPDSWQKYVDSFRYMVVTNPGKKPSSLRIDQLDKQNCESSDRPLYPLIIHHGLRPAQLSYAGDPVYKKKWREYMKFRHLLWNRAKVTAKDKEKLEEFEMELQKIRLKCTLKREITVEICSEGFLLTGIRADICQHAMLLPILFGHIRFHKCLRVLEKSIGYEFKDKTLLQLALTHSSYKVNHGTNPDHGRNSLSNCGSRQLEFGDYKIHIKHTRKRGLNVLLRIMSKMGKKTEERSEIPHNERLEFLGDAVVELITSTHLFYMFPYTDEGELTNYRGSLVQNAHLAVLANKLKLQDYLLYAHGPDLCHTRDLRHAMANCYEALMGALFLDGGIELADRVFSYSLFDEPDLLETWINIPKHPLQEDEPKGDRHWISNSPTLQKLLNFENDIGYEFRHVRLLAKSFTQRNIGYNHLTLGHNQRLEFLGDTIMKLISSDFLFRHFPDHHEGHLTLLRSSLVNNKTQSTVADEIGMPDFVISMQKEHQADAALKQKEKADLLEALLGALYVDGGLEPCIVLCDVCFFPRLEDFIMNQEWNDPKSQLQQCCLTLRDMNDESPDIPVYKVLAMYGPTNSRIYKVGVYFRDKRLAVGEGGSKQQGEMRAAENALKETKGLFHNRFWTLEKNMERRLHEQKKSA